MTDRDLRPALCERLLDAMTAAGCTVQGLVRLVARRAPKITRARVSRWLAGKGEPSAEELLIMCELLGVSARYLLGMRSTPTRPIEADPDLSQLFEILSALSAEQRSHVVEFARVIGNGGPIEPGMRPRRNIPKI